jgi:predicted DNA-binding transcriptional regulator
MVSKDQSIGGLIFIVCVVVGILYTVGLFYWGNPMGSEWPLQFWLIALPVFVAFVAIMGIGAWIGWTMATTPPPKPIEEISTEIEEKKEETPPPPPEPEKEAKPPEEAPQEHAKKKKP